MGALVPLLRVWAPMKKPTEKYVGTVEISFFQSLFQKPLDSRNNHKIIPSQKRKPVADC